MARFLSFKSYYSGPAETIVQLHDTAVEDNDGVVWTGYYSNQLGGYGGCSTSNHFVGSDGVVGPNGLFASEAGGTAIGSISFAGLKTNEEVLDSEDTTDITKSGSTATLEILSGSYRNTYVFDLTSVDPLSETRGSSVGFDWEFVAPETNTLSSPVILSAEATGETTVALEIGIGPTLTHPSRSWQFVRPSYIGLQVSESSSFSGRTTQYIQIPADCEIYQGNPNPPDGIRFETVVPDLEEGTRYYFRVKAVGGVAYHNSGWSNLENATTQVAPPALAAPQINSYSASGTSAIINFSSVPNAAAYQLEYSGYDDFDPATIVPNAVPGGFEATGLSTGSTYYWRVKALAGLDSNFLDSDWSDSVSFTTQMEDSTMSELQKIIFKNNFYLEATPAESQHVVNKTYVDSAITTTINGLNLPTTYAPAGHTHNASAITEGTVSVARLPVETAISASATDMMVPSSKAVYTWATGAFAAKTHNHAGTAITSGTVGIAYLPKVTTVAANSTDSYLPTALAVYTFVNNGYAALTHTHTAADVGAVATSAIVTTITDSSTNQTVPGALAVYELVDDVVTEAIEGVTTASIGAIASSALVTSITSSSTDAQIPSANAVYDYAAPKTHTHTNAQITGLGTAATKNTGTASGNIPVLDSNGKLVNSVIPAVAITNTFTAANETAMLALSTAGEGDIAIRTDLNKCFILASSANNAYATLANWKELLTPADKVQSVNGKTGTVTLASADVGAIATSAIQTAVSATSTDSQVPSAKCLYDDFSAKVHTHTLADITDEGTAATMTKVTTVSSSSTDDQAASAKAVYEFARNASNLNTGTVQRACLPVANAIGFGVVKAGDGIINTDGVLSVAIATSANYSATNDTSVVTMKAVKTFGDETYSLITHSHDMLVFNGKEYNVPTTPRGAYLAIADIISGTYSYTNSYNIGDYVSYHGLLYRCAAPVSAQSAWDLTKWTLVTVMESIGQVANSTGRYDGTFTGNGSATEFTITHNLGVRDVLFVVIDSNNNKCEFPVEYISTNAFKIKFFTAPAANETFRVTVRS